MRLSFKIQKRLGLLLTTVFTALFVLSLGSQIISKPDLVSSQGQNSIPTPISSLSNNQQVTSPLPISPLRVVQPPAIIPVAPPPKPIVPPAMVSPPINVEKPLDFSVRSNPIVEARGQQYGHFPYAQASSERLDEVGKFVRDTYTRSEQLDFEAARAFQDMRAAARANGVSMMPISGFRNVADQQELFDRQTQRRGSVKEAAKYSAPPGHSEHHTGYALDITDERRSDVDLKVAFDETEVYRWLLSNAAQFGFEQSFPPNNPQGISYEPWHWRYIGSPQAQSVFAAAKEQRS